MSRIQTNKCRECGEIFQNRHKLYRHKKTRHYGYAIQSEKKAENEERCENHLKLSKARANLRESQKILLDKAADTVGCSARRSARFKNVEKVYSDPKDISQKPRPTSGQKKKHPDNKMKNKKAITVHKDTFDEFIRFVDDMGCESQNEGVIQLLNLFCERYRCDVFSNCEKQKKITMVDRCKCISCKEEENYCSNPKKQKADNGVNVATAFSSSNLEQIATDKIKVEIDEEGEEQLVNDMSLDKIKTEVVYNEEVATSSSVAFGWKSLAIDSSKWIKKIKLLQVENASLTNEIKSLNDKLNYLTLNQRRFARYSSIESKFKKLTLEIANLEVQKHRLLESVRSHYVNHPPNESKIVSNSSTNNLQQKRLIVVKCAGDGNKRQFIVKPVSQT